MSHQSTPHLHNKRTPGTLTSETPSQLNLANMTENTITTGTSVPDASRSVCDASAATPRQLLNAYIYDFLVKNTMPLTAKAFAAEAELPHVSRELSAKASPHMVGLVSNTPPTPAAAVTQMMEEHNLPQLAMSMDAPQGFLYEWWLVFWDVFQAKQMRTALPQAAKYFQMQYMKQKQHNELQGLDGQQSYSLAPPPAGHVQPMAQFNQAPVMVQPPLGPVPVPQVPRQQQFPQLDPR